MAYFISFVSIPAKGNPKKLTTLFTEIEALFTTTP